MKQYTSTMGPNAMKPFPCLFVSAIVFGVILRLLDIFILASSTGAGLIDLWLGHRIGTFGIGDLVFACGILFLLLSILGIVTEPRSFAGWMTLEFCLILVCYTAGLRYFPEASRLGTVSLFFVNPLIGISPNNCRCC